jgi:hypothetical protein
MEMRLLMAFSPLRCTKPSVAKRIFGELCSRNTRSYRGVCDLLRSKMTAEELSVDPFVGATSSTTTTTTVAVP